MVGKGENPQVEAKVMGARVTVGCIGVLSLIRVGKSNLAGRQDIGPVP